MGSLIDTMKQRVANSGKAGGKMFRVKASEKKRFRFLTEADQGVQIVIHDKFPEVTTPCYQQFGRPCPYDKMDREEIRTRDNFAWAIWDYENKEVKIFMWKANEKTPVPAMISFYETYGTLLDRDYVLERRGERFETAYTLTPLDKSPFKGKATSLNSDEIMRTVAQVMNPELLETQETTVDPDDVDDLFGDEDDE